jgi:predicted N-acyltransferase
MDGADGLTLSLTNSLTQIDRAAWNACANPAGLPFDPFVSWEFLEALESSGCAVPRQGWAPHHVLARRGKDLVGVAPLYLKSHSQGEYVFDRGWADALYNAGGAYYPKAQGAVPFTPATGRRLLTRDPNDHETEKMLALGAIEIARQAQASSVHFTFLSQGEQERLTEIGYLRRVGVQFHWRNEGYGSFGDFLAALSSIKRKNIRRERREALKDISVRRLTGADLTEKAWDIFYECYMDTGSRKWGRPYLNRKFLSIAGERLADRTVLFLAERGKTPVASALNFLGGDTLYGRYWGQLEYVPFLHFELCYYQAIELAIELGLKRVEAGAQGEHKLARGYAPEPTYSAHWIAHQGLRNAVKRFLDQERPAVADEITELDEHTPFKKLDIE